jgi:autotransporter-associated beta strand protein
LPISIVAGSLLFHAGVAGAQAQSQSDWNVPSGDWSVAGNWYGGVPTSNSIAIIQAGFAATITQPGEVCDNLFLGFNNSSGAVQMIGGELAANYEYLAYTMRTDLTLNQFTGQFTQSGGTNTTSSLCIGQYFSGNGVYQLNGGTLIASEIFPGQGTGVFNFNGGLLQAAVGANTPFMSGLTSTYVQSGGANIDTNGQSITISQPLLNGGGGGLTKYGFGTLTLTGSNTYTGGTTVNQGTLQGNTVSLYGSITNNAAVAFDQDSPGIYSGSMSGSGSLTKMGGSLLALTGNNTYTGNTYINSGTLEVDSALPVASGSQVQIGPSATLIADASIPQSIFGAANSSQIAAAAGNVSLGDPTSYTGFNHAGTLTVGNNTVTLNSAGFANLGVLTTLGGGTLAAPNGVSLGVGCNLVGWGSINGKIAAGYGSTINATGILTLGDSTSPVGFVSNGELYTNANTVTILSNNAANNKNAVVLGSLTEIDGGNLVAPNGILLNSGNNLITTDAGGTVSGGTASRFLNRGNVQGPSSASSNYLIFNMLFKGSTGQTSGRIGFLGGFATGDSPGVNTQYGATLLGGTGTEFDIGGPTPGNTDNNYGQLNIVTNPIDLNNHGDLTLLQGTSFKIIDVNGFVPTPGETFTVLTWDGTLSGTASLAVDPAFTSHGIQFVPEWNSNSLVLDATPEPSTLFLLAAGALGLVAYSWRRRKQAV